MKPYRGMLLAAAVLLAALPFAGCGDADDYAESGAITLTSDLSSVAVKDEVVFTVVSIPTTTTPATASAAPGKVILDECEMALEYRTDGAGLNKSWSSIPGSGPTRVFKLVPKEIGTLNVLSRGRCAGSNEEWEYSATVKVAVVDRVLPEVTAVMLSANPTSTVRNRKVTFTLGATWTEPNNDEKCTLNLSYQYSGAGLDLTTVYPAYIGQFLLTPTLPGKLVVTANGWCSESPSVIKSTTTTVDVTNVALPTVTSVTLTSNVDSIAFGGTISFTISVTADAGCTVNRNRKYSGGGFGASPITVPSDPTFDLTPTAQENLVISASAYCSENPGVVISSMDKIVTVTP